jgi:V8-like Glu-specific endopeptidase
MKARRQRQAQQKTRSRRDAAPPMADARLAGAFTVVGKAKVPERLQDIEVPEPTPYRLSGILRNKVARVASTPLAPMRPDWVSSVVRPKKAPVPPPVRKLMHRGRPIQPGLVFAPDDRRTYSDWSYPWGTICKVVTAVGHGSGVIVGPRHVLTASHAVDWSRDGAGSVEVHRSGGTIRATTAITAVWYYTKVTGSVEWFELDEDYAVLVTASRIGDRFGWLGTRTYHNDWDGEEYWYSIGYPTDIGGGNSPVWQRRKWLDEDFWDFFGGSDAVSMETDADMIPGQSGSPMFAWWANGPYVVAVWSGYSSDENWCSGGGDMTRLVRHARNQDP